MIRLLIADDSALMRKLLAGVFDAEGDFDVTVARDGEEALEQALRIRPDVVTLDVQMPRMDGLSCLDRLMIEAPCPVVMVSAVTAHGADATLEAMRLGAVDFVPKPAGAVSLAIDSFGQLLVAKVRAAAKAKLRRSLRLTERVRHRTGGLSATAAPVADLASARARGPAGLVLIGTSTGGPPALETVLTQLPANFPWPVLVAQHMPATFTSAMARRLDGLCALDVMEVGEATPLRAGQVHIARGDADVLVSTRAGGPVALPAPASSRHLWHPSVDRMVESAMEHLPSDRLVGVLMTGMGNDGAEAMTRLRARGGRTIAEAESTAVVWGMPGELVRAGGAEVVAPVDEIATAVLAMVA